MCYNSLLQRDVRAQMCENASRTGDFVRVCSEGVFPGGLVRGIVRTVATVWDRFAVKAGRKEKQRKVKEKGRGSEWK